VQRDGFGFVDTRELHLNPIIGYVADGNGLEWVQIDIPHSENYTHKENPIYVL
jgi:hypothetical protein